jgi:D-alanyl-D-alanine carboxypeptidase (penicillin-binding protein 5/6)
MLLTRSLARACVAAVLVAATGIVAAQALQPPEVAAKSYLVLDLTPPDACGAQRGRAVRSASLTKLMTAYLVFTAIHDKKLALEQTLPVSKRAWSERKGGGSLMFIDTTMTPKSTSCCAA